MARGKPPNAAFMNARQIESMLKRNNPKLKPEEGFPQELCDLVACVLELKPERRPSMDEVLNHPYIYETDTTHPTTILRQLIRVYEDWASSGGQRQSLIQPSGAAAAEFPDDPKDLGDWRFSLVSIGDSAYDNVDNAMPSFHIDPAMEPTMDLELLQREENNLNSLIPEPSYMPDNSPSNLADQPDDSIDPAHDITMKTSASTELRIRGVGTRFANFFEGAGYSGSEATQPAELSRPRSDLQLRNDTSESDASQKENSRRKTNFRGTPVDTARANQSKQPSEQPMDRDARRGTLLQSWDWDSASKSAQEPQQEYTSGPNVISNWSQNHPVRNHSFEDLGAPGDDVEVAGHPYVFPSRPALHHYATAPVEPPMLHSNIDTASSRQTLDLDALMNAPPPQQYGYNNSAPYQLYENEPSPAAMHDTHEYGYNALSPSNDYHVDAVSPTSRAGPEDDQSQYATITGHPTSNGTSSYGPTENEHGSHNGISHTPTDSFNDSTPEEDSFNGSTPEEIARPTPPSAAAMAGDAPQEVIEAELLRLFRAFGPHLRTALEDTFRDTDSDEEDDSSHHTELDDN